MLSPMWRIPTLLGMLLVFPLAVRAQDPPPVSIDQLDINREEAVEQQLHFEGTGKDAPATDLTPLQLEMREILAKEAELLRQMAVTLKQATDPTTIRTIEREMADVKQATEISLLRAQAQSARDQGLRAQADAIDVAIQLILNPVVHIVPSDRPAPKPQH